MPRLQGRPLDPSEQQREENQGSELGPVQYGRTEPGAGRAQQPAILRQPEAHVDVTGGRAEIDVGGRSHAVHPSILAPRDGNCVRTRQDRHRKLATIGPQRLDPVVDTDFAHLGTFRQPQDVLRPARAPILQRQLRRARPVALRDREIHGIERQRRAFAGFRPRRRHRQLLAAAGMKLGNTRAESAVLYLALGDPAELRMPDAADRHTPYLAPRLAGSRRER